MWLDNKLKSETRTLDYGHNEIINAFELQKNNQYDYKVSLILYAISFQYSRTVI